MSYLIMQIVFCLLIAFLLGVLVGWLLRGFGLKERSAALERAWRTRLDSSLTELEELRTELAATQEQLKEQKAGDRLQEVLEEVPRVREDLGFPPLVTPTSQIVGVQAVHNVLAGERYKRVTRETKDYVKGLYGRAPAPIRNVSFGLCEPVHRSADARDFHNGHCRSD